METFTPQDEQALAKAISSAADAGTALRIMGHGTRAGLGRPVRAAAVLQTAALAGVEDYQPEELTFTALAGTPLADIEAMLAEKGQMLPFEPPCFAEVLSAFGAQATAKTPDLGTLGGAVSIGMAGPRQILRWSVRDHVLGFSAVNGRGELFKAGGRVVKNVTGYDLPKLMSGSFGTLAVLTRLTIRVLPAPEHAITLINRGLSARAAVAAMSKALLTPAEVSAACWLPETLTNEGVSLTALRLEGFAGSLRSRAEMLRAALAGHGDWALAEGENWQAFWVSVRDVRPLLAAAQGRWLWRITLAAAGGGALAEALLQAHPESRLFMDRAGGLLWLALPLPAEQEAPEAADVLRQLCRQHGAQAMLFAAPEAHRAAVPVFPPQPEALATLQERVRAQFDPADILNPGIMG